MKTSPPKHSKPIILLDYIEIGWFNFLFVLFVFPDTNADNLVLDSSKHRSDWSYHVCVCKQIDDSTLCKKFRRGEFFVNYDRNKIIFDWNLWAVLSSKSVEIYEIGVLYEIATDFFLSQKPVFSVFCMIWYHFSSLSLLYKLTYRPFLSKR